jgi:hypothetical protein
MMNGTSVKSGVVSSCAELFSKLVLHPSFASHALALAGLLHLMSCSILGCGYHLLPHSRSIFVTILPQLQRSLP